MPELTTVDLRRTKDNSLSLLGGKAANLCELIAAGLPVPVASCVTTHAYRAHLTQNALLEGIRAQLAGVDYTDVVDLDARSERIRAAITGAGMPPEVERDIRSAYVSMESELGQNVRISVRSSATAEDLPGMSFAGQQDTYLEIQGIDQVLDCVRRCWASLWTSRAIAYRNQQGIGQENIALAVVLQQMFPSEVAGIMFTANPITANTNEVFINTSWGLGEAIVSGQVNPDQYVVTKRDMAIKQKVINTKKLMTVRRQDGRGTEETEVPVHKQDAEAMSDWQIRELVGIGKRIEAHYGFPQDIEWGYADGRFAVLQSREVTAADIDFCDGMEAWQTPAAMETLRDERWLWSRAYSDEVQTGPSTPYFYSILQNGMTRLKWLFLELVEAEEWLGYGKQNFQDIPMYRWYGARAYYNAQFERERIRRYIPPFARDEAALWIFPAKERESVKNMSFNWPRFIWQMLKLHVTNPKVSLIETPQHVFENLENWVNYTQSVWDTVDVDKATVTEIFDTEMRAQGKSEFGLNVCLPFTIYLYVLPAALKTLCKNLFNDDGTIYNSLVGGLFTKTSEENGAVWKLAQHIRASTVLSGLVAGTEDYSMILPAMDGFEEGIAFKKVLGEFIVKYGHRGGAERDPIHYRWRHKPEMVFHSVVPMLKLGEEDDPVAREQALHERMLKTKAECIEKLRKYPFGGLIGMAFKWFVALVQEYFYYRDFERFYNDKNMSRPRDFLTAIGRKFIARGLMQVEEDIFFLGKEEIRAVDRGELTAREIDQRIRSRRRVYQRYATTEPPKYVRGWEAFDDDMVDSEGALKGIGASNGVVTGRARVCRKLDEIRKIEKGDILVTVATDPGWTTVFSIIGGVVVETGGVVAHAVMISREYGLPCVANLTSACNLIPDGATITVDGTSGRVLIHTDE